ncbi:PTS lactose/cellobiose transporter subunit IIA [Saccharococcus caldoxylosilyticus]|uniref:PTS system, cellobiose-specific IIA component n=1 Tax=Saccharococcus caldoxylosilyticus TaxID=81408 RepID=A0A150LX42_9BACL|nr:PTS lactose/cellobiose transporter subunit IIA [Parageobacillus caldoxylosilyticus]OQO99081.1 PTS lactose/cellobiose transporter subunit IIA [Geobacillus sp. 44B]KYD16512.1 PTS system, cellobiose-specific IIA component [Parageobacillus caldoxylosilyticus]QNU36992.1 PTS lactose/cellobiose transporter subunit IIA [Geobacillus sp. 44B]QXJ40275.1 Oligo-beta-mannoside-specific phosphotransferase enzyme IIA component [Parageobacillus caldoxylosilyticus]BDG36069.1 PTS system oligo-beta-mannoside-s
MEKIDLQQLTSEQIAFQLILHSGNARSKIIQALREYRAGNQEQAEQLLKEAEDELSVAHNIHFQMIQKEASGEKTEFSLLLMHAEDHVMSTLSMKELVKEMLELFKERNL